MGEIEPKEVVLKDGRKTIIRKATTDDAQSLSKKNKNKH